MSDAAAALPGYLPASAIPVHLCREVLVWPLALHGPASAETDWTLREVTRVAARIGPPWQAIDDPSEHIPAPAEGHETPRWNADRYAEAVYFHEFVQHFLFAARQARLGSANRTEAPFRLFRRSDVCAVEVTLGGGPDDETRSLTLRVERTNLYLFCTGAAALVLELRAAPEVRLSGQRAGEDHRPLHLSDVQDFHDQFRRTYIPYAQWPGPQPPPLVVREVAWRLTDGSHLRHRVDDEELNGMIRHHLDSTVPDPDTGLLRRAPPVFAHWRCLLPDALVLAAGDPVPVQQPRWHPVMDERMPTLLTVSVTPSAPGEPSQALLDATSPDDLVRLCFADSAGPAQRQSGWF